MEIDVVVPVRPGDNEELRYMLRSLRNLPHGRVHLFGEPPPWVNPQETRIVRRERTTTKFMTVLGHVYAACEDPEVSDPFYLFNDDIYVMEPLETLPHLDRGRVIDVIEEEHERGNHSSWVDGMIYTRNRLVKRGFPEPMSFELHVPLLVDKTSYTRAIEMGFGIGRWMPRTAYGAIVGMPSLTRRDVKVYGPEDTLPPGPFLSTEDRGFAAFRKHLQSLFPDQSIYERGGLWAPR
jgi:hypothetical protein